MIQEMLKSLKNQGIDLDEAEKKDNLEILRDIVKEKQVGRVNLAAGKTTKVDLFTASAIVTVYDAINDANKKKLYGLLHGNMKDFLKAQSICLKVLK